jgi:hypothetical protein
LYGCEVLAATLKAEQKLQLFENKVLRKMLGPAGDESII